MSAFHVCFMYRMEQNYKECCTPYISLNQGCHENPLVGGVRLNLPEFVWLITCSIVNALWLFASGRGRKLRMAVKSVQHTGHSLVSSVDYRARHG